MPGTSSPRLDPGRLDRAFERVAAQVYAAADQGSAEGAVTPASRVRR